MDLSKNIPNVYLFKNCTTSIGKKLFKDIITGCIGYEIEVPMLKNNVSTNGNELIFKHGCFSIITQKGAFPIRDFIVTGYKTSKDQFYLKISLGEVFYTIYHPVYKIVKDTKSEMLFYHDTFASKKES